MIFGILKPYPSPLISGRGIDVDFPMLAGCLALLGLGLVMITSSSSEVAAAQSGNTLYMMTRHLVYLIIGLLRFAEPLYRGELTAEDPAIRAAALFGYGRLEYALNHFKEAAERFRQAEKLYRGLKWSEEETAARDATKRAVARIPPPAPSPVH